MGFQGSEFIGALAPDEVPPMHPVLRRHAMMSHKCTSAKVSMAYTAFYVQGFRVCSRVPKHALVNVKGPVGLTVSHCACSGPMSRGSSYDLDCGSFLGARYEP